MIEREITPYLVEEFESYPFVTVMGPRQSGKTTLCRSTFPHLPVADLDIPDVRELATNNPREFLAQYPDGAIIDEVHRANRDLFGYLKVLGDNANRNGLFVLTGSNQQEVLKLAAETLIGRTGLLRLLPFTLAERRHTGASENIKNILYTGCYPGIFNQELSPTRIYSRYYQLFVQNDARIGDIDIEPDSDQEVERLDEFVRQCATRTGQLLDLTTVASDVGVKRTVAQKWLNDLIRSDIVFLLQPYSVNPRKRLAKTPKLYFHDVGLATYLLGVREPGSIDNRARGALFENLVVTEALKHRYNQADDNNLSFYHDNSGVECDLIYEQYRCNAAIEIKSGTSLSSRWFEGVKAIRGGDIELGSTAVVYGGTERVEHQHGPVIPFTQFRSYLVNLENTLGHIGTEQAPDAPPPPKPSTHSIDF